MTPLRVRLLSLAGAFSLGLVGVAVSTDTAMACSCVYAADDPRNLERADVVFEGVIVDDSGAEQGSGTRRITLRSDPGLQRRCVAVSAGPDLRQQR